MQMSDNFTVTIWLQKTVAKIYPDSRFAWLQNVNYNSKAVVRNNTC
jgi:hypothetical protein